MASQRDREAFVGVVVAEGGTVSLARTLMRHSAALHRLAEAECNGDWPYDNGERAVEPCKGCEQGTVPGALKRTLVAGRLSEKCCPSCRHEMHVQDAVRAANAKRYPGRDWKAEDVPVFAAECKGDPRGAVVRLHVPSGRDEGWGGVAVP